MTTEPDEREEAPKRLRRPPRASTNHCGNCNKDYEFPAQESRCPHGPRKEITYCSVCGNFTEYACSDCRIGDRAIIYVCHKDVCQREHEAAKKHATNELFNRLDQTANDVCVFLLSHRNADAKSIIVKELRETASLAATRMRQACVEKINELTEPERRKLQFGTGATGQRCRDRIRFSNEIIAALESLTLDGEKEQ